MVGFLIVFILLYGGLNYYIGLRGWQSVGSMVPFLNIKLYWVMFWMVALSYLVGRLSGNFLPDFIRNSLTLIGSYWMAAMLYFTIIIVFIDIVRLIDRWFGFLPQGLKQNSYVVYYTGIAVLVLMGAIFIAGTWNARNPKVSHYDLTVPKDGGKLQELHIVMVSDIHLGNIMHNGRLATMVDMINDLKPDLILFAGDTIDEDVEPFIKQNMADTFRQLKSNYGVFAVLGNHEYIGGNVEEAIKNLQEAGVRVLKDEWVKIEDSFYIIGRDDLSSERFGKNKRKSLAELTGSIDKSMPLILLDHQPRNLNEAAKEGIDLQLSGHTHRGQLFPNQLITGRIYEVDWGYLKKDDMHVVVSSGFGTWGPPIRVGNRAEIVDITLHFQK